MRREEQVLLRLGTGISEEAPVQLFGNKAAMLAHLGALGLPIPPGFSLSSRVCQAYFRRGRKLPEYLPDRLEEGLAGLERSAGHRLGDARNPLLVSVRSGSSVSMPGMMSTLLNVGLNQETVEGLILRTGEPRFAWDAYRRLLEGFSEVLGLDAASFQRAREEAMASCGATDQRDLDHRALRRLASSYETAVREGWGHPFPPRGRDQLDLALKCVLDSWMCPRAKSFRATHGLHRLAGTAVTVQEMVFGNLGVDSGAGVMFTRNPWTGEDRPLVDFQRGMQGEDVVSRSRASGRDELSARLPQVYTELTDAGRKVEASLRDMQDIEFTVQEGSLFLLQTRRGLREPLASLRIALDLHREGIIDRPEAAARLQGLRLERISVQEVDPNAVPAFRGEPASAGVVTGKIALSVDVRAPGALVLVVADLLADDLAALGNTVGVIMPRGSRTSHAVVVAREMGKTVIVNCPGLEIDAQRRLIRVAGHEYPEGTELTLDGASGLVYEGKVQSDSHAPVDLLRSAQRILGNSSTKRPPSVRSTMVGAQPTRPKSRTPGLLA